MLECRYCATVFSKLPEEGNCPKCGGPGPKRLEPARVEVIKHEYMYITGSDAIPYYLPSRGLSPLQSIFSTFGFKTVTFVLIMIVASLVISFVSWLLWRAPGLKTTDPSYQFSLSTTQPTATQAAELDPWKDESWLSFEEAQKLRKQENIVNLAYLDRGGAQYSAEHSFVFIPEEPWVKTKPLGLTTLSVTDTAIQIKASGHDYTLNVYQPFVLMSQPEKVVTVDAQGVIWQAELSDLSISSLNDVVSKLPIVIAPNPNLTYSY